MRSVLFVSANAPWLAGLDAFVVYADREHFANMAYLTGFEPRFEEALLLLVGDKPPWS